MCLSTCCCLQNLAGKPAGGPTAEEFADFIKDVDKEMRARIEDPTHAHSIHELWPHDDDGNQLDPLYSYDNTNIHEAAWQFFGGMDILRYPLPPYSPDMHKVIEHVHAIICTALRSWITHEEEHAPGEVVHGTLYMDKLTEIFNEKIQPSSIKKDCMSLVATYRAIIHSDGSYPPKRFR